MKILAVFVVLGVFVLADCVNDNLSSITGGTTSNNVELRDLANNPEQYAGKNISVSGEMSLDTILANLDPCRYSWKAYYDENIDCDLFLGLTKGYGSDKWGNPIAYSIIVKKDPQEHTPSVYTKSYTVIGIWKKYEMATCTCMEIGDYTPYGQEPQKQACLQKPFNASVDFCHSNSCTARATQDCKRYAFTYGGSCGCVSEVSNTSYVPSDVIQNSTLFYYLDATDNPFKSA